MIFSLLLGKIGNHFQSEKFSNEHEADGIQSLYLYMIGYNSKYYYVYGVTDYIFLAVFYLTAFAISVASAYLSYSCTWKGSVNNTLLRVISAIFAFLLGPIYLIWYFFVNYVGGLC